MFTILREIHTYIILEIFFLYLTWDTRITTRTKTNKVSYSKNKKKRKEKKKTTHTIPSCSSAYFFSSFLVVTGLCSSTNSNICEPNISFVLYNF